MSETTDYQTIFNGVESTLIRIACERGRDEELRRTLDESKTVANKNFTDADYFRTLVLVAFYAGFKAETVTGSLRVIEKYFGDYETVTGYGPDAFAQMMADSKMIKNRRKIAACIKNAQTFKSLVNSCGSFQKYVDSFNPKTSFDNLMDLRKDLERRFRYLSKITSFHFLTEIGMPVLKPDRVIRRVFFRLGLIKDESESEERLLETVHQGERFVQATSHPIRYIDLVFVAYGQVNSTGIGISQGICLKDNPRCHICGVKNYCPYFLRARHH
jgi:DNA-3-methyladenine glycosylase I